MKLLRQLIKEALLLEAKENAEFLVKLNYDVLKKEKPDIHPKELNKIAHENGPLFDGSIISSLNSLNLTNGMPRSVQLWLGNLMKNGEKCPKEDTLDMVIGYFIIAKLDIEDIEDFKSVHEAEEAWEAFDMIGDPSDEEPQEDINNRKLVARLDDTFTIQTLDPESALWVGNKLGHCYKPGGREEYTYQEGIKDGSKILFCLFKNKHPKVTFCYNTEENSITQIKGIHDRPPRIPEYVKKCNQWLKTTSFDYENCENFIQMNIKKERILLAKEKGIDAFFDEILFMLKCRIPSRRDETKMCIGVAMSCVHLTKDVEQTTKIISKVRDWTNGEINEGKELAKFTDKLLILCKNDKSIAALIASNVMIPGGMYAYEEGAAGVFDLAIERLGYSKQDIISAVEKEIRMPIEDFLFKEESQKVNESLIKSFILIVGDNK